MKYRWLITINGIEYRYDASNAWTAVKEVMKTYDKKRPKAKKMSPEIKKALRQEGAEYIDALTFDANYIISVRKLGVVTKDGIFK